MTTSSERSPHITRLQNVEFCVRLVICGRPGGALRGAVSSPVIYIVKHPRPGRAVALRQTYGMADPPRDEVARIIIELAQAGERDPDFLCEAVLKALGAAELCRTFGTYPWGRNYALAAAAPLPSWTAVLQPRFGGADLTRRL
jgi:hypothetical protein